MDAGSPSPCHGTRNKVDVTTWAESLPFRIIGMRLTDERFHVVALVLVFEATVTVVDVDSGAEEKMTVISQGSATGLNLKESQRIYFGGLPTIANYRYIWFNTQTLRAGQSYSELLSI